MLIKIKQDNMKHGVKQDSNIPGLDIKTKTRGNVERGKITFKSGGTIKSKENLKTGKSKEVSNNPNTKRSVKKVNKKGEVTKATGIYGEEKTEQRRYTKSRRNTNKLLRVKTGPSVGEKISNLGEKISSTIGSAFDKEKTPPTTPSKNEMVHSQILNEYDSPASRLQTEFSLNQDAMQALVAGGSRPMHQGTSSQIDPMTGMPIVPGGQMNINPAFGGAMANSGIPNYNPSMNMANITQARIEMSRNEKKDQIMSRDLPNEVKQNMIEGINQEAKKLGTAAAKLAPTIVQHQSVLKATPLITAPLKTDTSSFSYKIGNKRPRKSMVVKRNK